MSYNDNKDARPPILRSEKWKILKKRKKSVDLSDLAAGRYKYLTMFDNLPDEIFYGEQMSANP